MTYGYEGTLWLEPARRARGTARQRKATERKRLQYRRKVLRGKAEPLVTLHYNGAIGEVCVGDLLPSHPNLLFRVIAVKGDLDDA